MREKVFPSARPSIPNPPASLPLPLTRTCSAPSIYLSPRPPPPARSANRLTSVAAAIGQKRVNSDLFPILGQALQLPVDESLASIARQLANVYDLAGGAANPGAQQVLPLLETLAGEEEVVVRTHAANSLSAVIPKLPKPDVSAKALPLFKRLAGADWFASRVTACGFAPALYGSLTDAAQQGEVKTIFIALCNDETPMVRRAGGVSLGAMALRLPRPTLKTDIYPIVKGLATDDRDNLRSLALESISEIGDKVDPAEFASSLLPLVEGLLDDQSWRVRQSLATAMPKICEGHADAVSSKRLVPLYVRLVRDRSPEVRATAVGVLGALGKTLGPAGLESLAAVLESISQDPSPQVKVELASNVLKLCASLPKEVATKYVVPVFQALCREELFEVRNSLVEEVEVLIESAGAAVLSSTLLTCLLDLAKDPKWRVRMGVVGKLGVLAKMLGAKVFEKRVQSVLVLALSDHVYAIRERTCEQVGQVVQALGAKWAVEKLFPPALALYDRTQNYLHRMTCLFFILHTAQACPGDVIERHLLQLVLTATSDEVANVRVAAAKCLVEIIPRVDKKLVQTKVKPAMAKNVADPDLDVAYFSSLALKLCG